MVTNKRATQALQDVFDTLRQRLPDLRQRYRVRALGIFGSYVRGAQRSGSDLDVLVEFEDDARPNLFSFVELREELSATLGMNVDLVEKRGLKPYIGKRILDAVVWVADGGEEDEAAERKLRLEQGGAVIEREYLDFLQDIVTASEQADRFTAETSFERFAVDELRLLAVAKAIENMGEAAKRIPQDVRRRYPEIPWSEMTGMRDNLAHGYFKVKPDIVWRVARELLPPLIPSLRRALESEVKVREREEQNS